MLPSKKKGGGKQSWPTLNFYLEELNETTVNSSYDSLKCWPRFELSQCIFAPN